MINPYEILGVSNNSSEEVCKKAYKLLVKKCHPDIGGNAEDFRRVNEAYNLLKRYNFNNSVILDICGVSVKYGLSHKDLFTFSIIKC